MSPDEAIQFLEAHQPMPPDADLTEELIGRFDEARRTLEHHYNRRTAHLLLNSLGEGDGLGVYQLVDATLRTLPRGDVVEALAEALRSPVRSVRAWSMEMALEYPEGKLVPHAIRLLRDSDRDQRVFAAYFLSTLDRLDATTIGLMREAQAREDDEEIQSILQDALTRV
jgi:hypothetical protein